MTADEFLRDLALRVGVLRVAREDTDGEGIEVDDVLAVELDSHDAEEFLNLTGVRVE